MSAVTEYASLAGGCFWCLEAVFLELKGVRGVRSGYAGGARPNPTYEQVCTGTTGHAEVARVEFDPEMVSYKDLLDVFFTIHDPYTLNRQGGDKGTQYRSAIFLRDAGAGAHCPREHRGVHGRKNVEGPDRDAGCAARHVLARRRLPREVFLARNPQNPYCAVVIAPKVAKARKHFLEKLAK